MDISKILEIGKYYISDYVNMVLTVFTNPQALHEETVKNYGETQNSLVIIPPQTNISKSLKKFPPQIVINVFISIFIGFVLNGLNPSLDTSDNLVNWVLLVTPIWLMYLLIIFPLFKLLSRGKLKLLDFLAVGLQIIASAYIVSSFLSLLSSFILKDFTLYSMQLSMVIYISIQILLLLILIPVALSKFR